MHPPGAELVFLPVQVPLRGEEEEAARKGARGCHAPITRLQIGLRQVFGGTAASIGWARAGGARPRRGGAGQSDPFH